MALCGCGCGQATSIARQNDPKRGYAKGDPLKFIRGHSSRVIRLSWWKGDEASYNAIHTYLRKHYPKAGACEACGKEGRTDYALIKGRSYSRDRNDYMELCRRCHVFYDEIGYCGYWKKLGLQSGPDGEAPLCKCGCGLPVSWSSKKRRWLVYAEGHFNRAQSATGTSHASPGTRKSIQRPSSASCAHCGQEFTPKRSDQVFCSKACKAAKRRADRKDDIERVCHMCGDTFSRNRFDEVAHCSRSCAVTCSHAGNCPAKRMDEAA